MRPRSYVPILGRLDVTAVEDHDRSEDLLCVASGPREPAITCVLIGNRCRYRAGDLRRV